VALYLLLCHLFCCALWHWSFSHTRTSPGPSCPIPIPLLCVFTVKTRRQKKKVSIQYLYFLCGTSCLTEMNRHTGSISIMFKICRIWQSQVSKVSTVTMLQAGPYGVQILAETESYWFSETFRLDMGPTRLLFKGTGGSFAGAMWPVHRDHQSQPSTAKVKNEWSHTTNPPHTHSQQVQRQLFLPFHCTFSFPSLYTQIKLNTPYINTFQNMM